MESKRLKLPAGLPTFEEIRAKGYLYVDKTHHLVNLIDTGKLYFLARPRRFGKSLTLTTFEALFSGRKDLFKGLYAEEFLNRPEFKPSPVIRIDMGGIGTDKGIEGIEDSLKRRTLLTALELEVEVDKTASARDVLAELIVRTTKKYDSKVVFLLDEYDKPYTDFVNNPNMAPKVRELLRGYYSQIKANDKHISFIFITGISKFTKMGVFSTLNNITDISLYAEYGDICGLTEEEIIKYFPDYLDETAKKFGMTTEALFEKMKNYYNGFCFDVDGKHRLYNPYSTLRFFHGKMFLNYWIESGTSSMFVDYLKSNKLSVEQFRNFSVSEEFFNNSTEIEKAKPESFLFQTGYLSLRKGIEDSIALDYPNTEVLNSLSLLVSQYVLEDNGDDFTYCRSDLISGLLANDHKLVVSALNRLLASIPYDDFSAAAVKKNISDNQYDMKPQEWLYRSNIISFLRGCGLVVVAEMHTNLGRADLVVRHKDKIWVFELKVAYAGENPEKKAEKAYRQMIDKHYAQPFPDAVCIAMAIDDTVRQITHFKFET